MVNGSHLDFSNSFTNYSDPVSQNTSMWTLLCAGSWRTSCVLKKIKCNFKCFAELHETAEQFLSLFCERWNGDMGGFNVSVIRRLHKLWFLPLLGLIVRGTGQHHLLLLLSPDNAAFFPRQAQFLRYLHFISPLHEIAALCCCTKRGFVS